MDPFPENVWDDSPLKDTKTLSASAVLGTADEPYNDPYRDSLEDVDLAHSELANTLEGLHLASAPAPAQHSHNLLSSLTEGGETSFSVLGSAAVPQPGESLFADDEEGPLGGLGSLGGPLGMAEDDGSAAPTTPKKAGPRGVASPNRRKHILRPRRRASKSVSVDPLKESGSVKAEAVETSPSAQRNRLIASMDKPLYDIPKGGEAVEGEGEGDVTPAQLYKFDITVGDPVKIGDLTTAHIVYTITTHSDSPGMPGAVTEVTRRYRDFLWLYHRLLNNHPGYIISPPPEKQVYGRFDGKFIENRRIALEKMLNKIAARAVFQADGDLVLFLASPKFSSETREREVFKHGGEEGGENAESSINEETVEPADSLSQALHFADSNTASGGFFSTLMGLNAPKYVETDQFVLEKQAYVETLDSQLRDLSKQLDFILEKREELIKTQGELARLVGALADIEVNADITELLGNFEELQTNIEQLLERTNLSQVMTMGATIDEYIRVIGSVRNCFENRFKLCNSVLNLDSQQKRKQKQLAKLRAGYNNQTDKVQRAEKDLAALTAALSRQTEYRDRFNTVFKSELGRFEAEKVREFKNVIEIYWEGLVENQKQLIELWEAFYEKCGFE